MPLTYRDIKERLNDLTDEQLDMFANVVVPDPDDTGEFALHNIGVTCFPDILVYYGLDKDIVMDSMGPDLPVMVVSK